MAPLAALRIRPVELLLQTLLIISRSMGQAYAPPTKHIAPLRYNNIHGTTHWPFSTLLDNFSRCALWARLFVLNTKTRTMCKSVMNFSAVGAHKRNGQQEEPGARSAGTRARK